MKASAVASPIGKVDVGADADAEVARLQRIIRVAHALETPSSASSPSSSTAGRPASARDAVLTRMSRLAERPQRVRA